MRESAREGKRNHEGGKTSGVRESLREGKKSQAKFNEFQYCNLFCCENFCCFQNSCAKEESYWMRKKANFLITSKLMAEESVIEELNSCSTPGFISQNVLHTLYINALQGRWATDLSWKKKKNKSVGRRRGTFHKWVMLCGLR